MTLSAFILESPQRVRRLDSTQSRPRSLDMVGDGNRPVLEWTLNALRQIGAATPVYVGGYHIEKVIESFPGLAVRYHHNRDSEGELGALCCCEPRDGPMLLLSAATVVLPGALERLSSSALARGIYADDRPAGVYFVSAVQVGTVFATARELLGRQPNASLDALFAELSGVTTIDLEGLAAPVADQEGVARTIFRGKAQTLDNLKPHVRGAAFLPRERVPAERWRGNRDVELDRIAAAFNGQTVAVRSSASTEDGLSASAAGKYRTVLNVQACDRMALGQAMDAVLDSYSLDGRTPDPDDEILVQPQLCEIKASGVLLTRDPRSGAPYFVINENRGSGRTDIVTAGGAGTLNQQFVAWSGRGAATVPSEIRPIVDVGSEVIQLSHLDALDIEYAVDASDTCHLLQARPLPAARQKSEVADDDMLDLIAGARQFVAERMRPVPGLLGGSTVLGVMPDWNPAEMIGASPRPLALSLYQMLVGESAWADARKRIGYRDVRPEPLIVVLGGRPYVDVRASLNSFLPATLDDKTGARWVDACLDRLRANPALHDKIEFEIALSCLTPDWDSASVRLKDAAIDPATFAEHLRPLTVNIVAGTVEPIRRQFMRLGHLRQRLERHLDDGASGLHGLGRRVTHMLTDCQRLGLVPFSILARYAFVAMSFLRGFVQTGVISREQYDAFLRAVPTVASTIAADIQLGLPMSEMVKRYGHLRPNSYEITSPNYAANPAQFLRTPANGLPVRLQETPADVLQPQLPAIERALLDLGIEVPPAQLITFIAEAIAGRERGKFEFMKSLNAALECIAALGTHLGFDRDVLSYLPVEDLMRLATDSGTQGDRAQWRSRAAFNQKRWTATRAMRLPDVVREADDVLAFRLEAWRANFVTRKRVSARAVWLDDAAPRPDLAGAIVVTRAADPGYDWIFAHGIAGLVTEYGGVASHMSIRAAEFGLPAAIGCGSVIMESLRGARAIELDCASEQVRPTS